MARYSQGTFTPKNIEKYIGKKLPTYRSSWELKVCQLFDSHPNIKKWGSECISIPYYNPIEQRQSIYIPDFLVVYTDKFGKEHAELIEVKPLKEASLNEAKSKRDKLTIAVNYAKWQAAEKFCKLKNMKFRVLTEKDIFRNA